MSYAEKILIVVGVILAVFTVFLYLPGEEKAGYFALLGDPATQPEGIIGLLFLKEDIVPFLAGELAGTRPNETARIGAIKVLARKYGALPDERIGKLLAALCPGASAPVRREIYRVIASNHQAADLDLFVRGVTTEEDNDSLKILLDNAGGYQDKLKEDPALTAAVRERLLVLRDAGHPGVRSQARLLLSREVTEIVDRAEKAAANFDFTAAEEAYTAARAILPDNRYLVYSWGKYFYKRRGDTVRGGEILEKAGFLYRAARATAAPEIDGKMDDPLWATTARLPAFYSNTSGQPEPATLNIEVGLRYDDQCLYLAAKGSGDYNRVVTNAPGRDGNVWEDDCCEVFIDPDADEQTYLQIIVNPKGTIYDATNDAQPAAKPGDRSRNRSKSNWNGVYRSKTFFAPGAYWSVEFAFPWKVFELEKAPAAGSVWGFNFVWTKQTKPAQYAQWTPTYGSAHMPWQFGFLVFE
ncbi:MAG: carbohydrate-binding family 9-like protein [Planctomycetota bacterium]